MDGRLPTCVYSIANLLACRTSEYLELSPSQIILLCITHLKLGLLGVALQDYKLRHDAGVAAIRQPVYVISIKVFIGLV